MTTLEALEAARSLIRNERDWFGKGTDIRGPESTQRCALLACKCDPGAANALRQTLVRMGQPAGIIHFNDSHTHAEVLELFNLAIQAELAKEERWATSDTSTSSRLSPVPA